MHTDYYALYRSTKILAQEARRIAHHGRKDEARDILRFIQNSRIVEILRPHNNNGILPMDVPHLEWQLRELENDCYPSAIADCKDDFTAIRSLLETLALGMQTILQLHTQKPLKSKRVPHKGK